MSNNCAKQYYILGTFGGSAQKDPSVSAPNEIQGHSKYLYIQYNFHKKNEMSLENGFIGLKEGRRWWRSEGGGGAEVGGAWGMRPNFIPQTFNSSVLF